jgi:SAM-dependent methyltransferase
VKKTTKEWYECWFDSPYYHILYKERDEKEAQKFLDNLIVFLKPSAGARILDVACGKGRHSIYLNQKGFDVTGFDLSPENIEYDQQFENEKLSFFLHDMREIYRVNYYDLVFNLFTSFGYFKKERDHEKTIHANAEALKKSGLFVLDYMNSLKVITSLVPEVEKEINGITFRIQKTIENGSVTKQIYFSDHGKEYEFQERLRLFTRNDFENYFLKYNLSITTVFGDYNLNSYDEKNSDRLILIAKKI